MKQIRLITLLALLTLFSGCSNTFLYNQLDWLVPWYVDDYVDLDRDQQRELKAQLRTLLAWHRSEELASYIVILDGIETDLQQPVTGAQVEDWANQGLAAWERIEARLMPLMFDLGRELSDEQMQEFIANLHRQQQELEEEYLERSDEEYIEDGRERLEESLSGLLGRLTDEQKQAIEASALKLLRFDYAWLEERGQWVDTLTSLLQREPGWEQAVKDALAAREESRTEAYRSGYRHNAQIINQTIAEVLNMRTAKQGARLLEEIEDYRQDLRKLIAQADTPAD